MQQKDVDGMNLGSKKNGIHPNSFNQGVRGGRNGSAEVQAHGFMPFQPQYPVKNDNLVSVGFGIGLTVLDFNARAKIWLLFLLRSS